MKGSLYFFSATGNSMKVAKELAQLLEDTELVHINHKTLALQLEAESDFIGFVVPAIFSGIPKMVIKFVETLEIKNRSAYIFVIATHGDRGGEGIVFEQISNLLKAKNLVLSASFGVQMPHNVPEKDHATTIDEQQRLFSQASVKISSIAQSVICKESVTYQSKKMKLFFSRLTYNGMSKMAFDKRFYVTDKCVGCERCFKLCPSNNIEMKDGKPSWKLTACQACCACIQWCPTTAIECGKSTVGVKRYHHPDIELQELLPINQE